LVPVVGEKADLVISVGDDGGDMENHFRFEVRIIRSQISGEGRVEATSITGMCPYVHLHIHIKEKYFLS